MLIRHIRFSSQREDTLGIWLIDDKFVCFTLEDEFRTIKKYGETRIPAGEYEIRLRKAGGFHVRYGQKFPDMHKGMLWLQDVPGFQYVLVHIGNRDDDTAGCILLGDTAQQNVTEDGFIGASTAAYRRIYPVVAEALIAGERVTIRIEDMA